MSNLALQKKDYNFFSVELDNKDASRKKRIRFVVLILLYIILTAGAYYLIERTILSTQDKINDLDAFLLSEEVATQRQQVAEKRGEILTLQEFDASLQAFIQHLEGVSIIGTEYIGLITSAVPHDLYFESLSMDVRLLQIQGTAPSRQIIAEYLNNMQALDLFQDVHISNITTVTTSNEETQTDEITYTFAMSCQLKDVMGE
jgi:Tfp pilus assembly protein PilN